jgi:hypothetical protein
LRGHASTLNIGCADKCAKRSKEALRKEAHPEQILENEASDSDR